MAKLKGIEKVFLVMRFATYDEPEEACKAFDEEFGYAIDRRLAWTYNAARPTVRKRLSADLLKIFDDTREAFEEDSKGIAIANQNYRLKELDRLYRHAKTRKGGDVFAAQLLEQAAKEKGGAFSNRRELTGAGGSPLKVLVGVDLDDV